jgi:hypothetical protein
MVGVMEGIAIYTAISGGYNRDRSDIMVFKDAPTNKFVEPVMNAKLYKILPHQFVSAPVRIWVDGNIFPLKDLKTIAGELLQGNDIAVFHHPWRNCIYDEHEPAKTRLDKKFHPLIDGQISRYHAEGMPRGFGLAECGVILSRDGDVTREFFNRWWAEVSTWSSRDQVSFPYVWWKMRDRIKVRLIGAMRQVDNKTRFGEWFRYEER